jgi:hypothetical protein
MYEYLNGFNYAGYLKRRLMVGQVDPWRRTDDGKPIYTILVTVDIAIKECEEWSNQDIGRTEFINYLKLNDILCFRNVDEFKKLKEELKEQIDETPLKLRKRQLSEEHKEKLRNNIKKARLNNPKYIEKSDTHTP